MRHRLLSSALTVVLTIATVSTPATAGRTAVEPASLANGCDPVDAASCLLPFPSDYYTVADSRTATGIRVNLQRSAMPENIFGTNINPWEWNRNDGFSPGSMLLVHVPGIDLAASGVATSVDIARSLAPDAPIVLINTATGARHPYWAELDANAAGNPGRQALIIRPARNLDEGTRYVVALRNLRTASGGAIGTEPVFASLLAPSAPNDPALHRRWEYAQRALGSLAAAGIGTAGLHVAWDFTVASRRSLTERVLHMRDEAFGRLGIFAPVFTIDSTTDYPDPAAEPYLQRQIQGTVYVPSYLNNTLGPPGSWLNYGSDGLPEQLNVNTQLARFVCNIPRSASAANPARPALYGHGLLGDPAEINSGRLKQYMLEHNTMFCATPWIGMATEDIPNVIYSIGEFSQFPSIPDRLQQSFLNFLFLGRAMIHTWAGFTTRSAFRDGSGKALSRAGSGQLVYLGNSQGGILGGSLCAIAKDFTRCSLGVPAANYSTLLNRSVDFDQFLPVFDNAYPDPVDRQLIFGLIQMVWDRGEANGYLHHLTADPLPGTPAKRVILVEAFGDHQVANIATQVQARTIGARVRTPILAPGRSIDVTPYWGIPTVSNFPYAGSALVVVDSGTPAPPPDNRPNTAGVDPHGHPANSPQIRAMIAHFLDTGELVDTCGGAPCTAPAG
ncbi:hypothetical protein [Plantactinospora sp. GCM10030261]|uniref:hypothetical protein n=1 Tax=Plantactinospora sp. GCM10030261 TaxID=3273420 RepID=UPI0036131FCA